VPASCGGQAPTANAIGAVRCHQAHLQIREPRFIDVGSAFKGGAPMITAKERCRLRTAAARVGVPLLACMAVVSTASAQSMTDVAHAITAAIALEHQTDIARRNLLQMQRSLTGNDAEAIHAVLTADEEFFGAYSEVVSVGQILAAMKYPEDRDVVRQFFADSSRNIVATVDQDADYINKFLPEISAPAAALEASKIRDSIVEVRNLFAPFVGKSGG
jgi:type IV secretory pathway VirB2 component (pilin)